MPGGASVDFGYTDGTEVESRLLTLVQAARDRSVLSMTLRMGITDWPSLYHLSPIRANLLRPLRALFSGRRVLEIGAGCGALTRFMGESGASVLALEGSPQRAAITAARCADLPNVTVAAETLQGFPIHSSFDLVIMVGVLEYARIFFPATAEEDPVNAMLTRAQRFLEPDGALLLAIENQLGLKYFAGYAEDHLGLPMHGIEDLYTPDSVVTFGRAELSHRLDQTGLKARQWLYPFPDYKLPRCLLTERAVQRIDDIDLSPLVSTSVAADPQRPSRVLFSLEQAWKTVYRNGLAGELANSFLVVATAGGPTKHVDDTTLAYHYSVDRRPQFAKQLCIHADGRTLAQRLTGDVDHESVPLDLRLSEEPFARGELWLMRLFCLVNQTGWNSQSLAAWVQPWLQQLATETGLDTTTLSLDTHLDGRLVDAVPHNLIITENGGCFIDLEWCLHDGIEFGHLFYRGIVLSLLAVDSVSQPHDPQSAGLLTLFQAVAKHYGWCFERSDCQRFHAAEKRFQFWATGRIWRDFDTIANAELPIRR